MIHDPQTLATSVGLLGGAAGFISIFVQARSLYLDSPRIRVDFTFALIPNTGKHYLSIEVMNRGGKAITIANVGVIFKSGNHSPFGLYPVGESIGPVLPFRLDSHSSATWMVSTDATMAAIKNQGVENRVAVSVKTALGRTRQSAFKTLEI